MFTRVHLENFRSFEEFELDLTEKANVPKKLVIVYGENGAGKSNVMSAFVLLNELQQTMDVRDAYEDLLNHQSVFNDEKMEALLKQKILSGMRDIQAIVTDYRMIGSDTPVVAEYEFCIGNNTGKYRVELGQEGIVYEKLEYLLAKRKGVHFECSPNEIFINKSIVKDKDLFQDIKASAKRFWGKHSLLAIILHEIADKSDSFGYDNFSDAFHDVLDELTLLPCYVKIGDRQWNSRYAPLAVFNYAYNGKIHKNNEEQLSLAEIVFTQLFCAINSDIQRVYYKRDYNDKWINYTLFLDKKIFGKVRSIDFSKESTGNHQLLDLFCYLLIACLGHTVVLDEADSGIHDLLFKMILQGISQYISGQIIMTTHNTTLMETDFAREATYILSEDENGFVSARVISSFEKRTYVSNNIRNKYLSGQYEGLPKVAPIDYESLINSVEDAVKGKRESY